MSSTDVADAFLPTREVLNDAGVADEFFLDLITSRLLIERVGETTNLGWWDSRVLSETGRARLEEVTPKTQLMSQINLASKVGEKAESDFVSADTISLFSFGPQFESRLVAASEDIEAAGRRPLEAVESISIQSLNKGWTDRIIEQIGSTVTVDSNSLNGAGAGDSFCIGERGYTMSEIDSEKWRLLVTLLEGYGHNTDALCVPYYPLKSELESESV
jgi:hypothetical protein